MASSEKRKPIPLPLNAIERPPKRHNITARATTSAIQGRANVSPLEVFKSGISHMPPHKSDAMNSDLHDLSQDNVRDVRLTCRCLRHGNGRLIAAFKGTPLESNRTMQDSDSVQHAQSTVTNALSQDDGARTTAFPLQDQSGTFINMETDHNSPCLPQEATQSRPAPQARMAPGSRGPITAAAQCGPDPQHQPPNNLQEQARPISISDNDGSEFVETSDALHSSDCLQTSDSEYNEAEAPPRKRKARRPVPLVSKICKGRRCSKQPRWYFLKLRGEIPPLECFPCRAARYRSDEADAWKWYLKRVKPRLQKYQSSTSGSDITDEQVAEVWTIMQRRMRDKEDRKRHRKRMKRAKEGCRNEDSLATSCSVGAPNSPSPEFMAPNKSGVALTVNRGSLRSHNAAVADRLNDTKNQADQIDGISRDEDLYGSPLASDFIQPLEGTMGHNSADPVPPRSDIRIRDQAVPSRENIGPTGNLPRVRRGRLTSDAGRALPLLSNTVPELPQGAIPASHNNETVNQSSTSAPPATSSANAAVALQSEPSCNQPMERQLIPDPTTSPSAQVLTKEQHVNSITSREDSSLEAPPAPGNCGQTRSSSTRCPLRAASEPTATILPFATPAAQNPLLGEPSNLMSIEDQLANLDRLIKNATYLRSEMRTKTGGHLLQGVPLDKCGTPLERMSNRYAELKQSYEEDQRRQLDDLTERNLAIQRMKAEQTKRANELKQEERKVLKIQEHYRKRDIERRLKMVQLEQ